MLGKLLKYEFRATVRIMLPVICALLALSVVARIAAVNFAGSRMMTIIGAFFVVAYFLAILAAAALTTARRRCRNAFTRSNPMRVAAAARQRICHRCWEYDGRRGLRPRRPAGVKLTLCRSVAHRWEAFFCTCQ